MGIACKVEGKIFDIFLIKNQKAMKSNSETLI